MGIQDYLSDLGVKHKAAPDHAITDTGDDSDNWEYADWEKQYKKSVIELKEFDEALHPRDDAGRFADAGGGGTGSTTYALAKTPDVAYRIMSGGSVVHIPSGMLRSQLDTLITSPLVNLEHMQIEGEKNLFSNHLREIPRGEMPQIPPDPAGFEKYQKFLTEQGLKYTFEEVDPRDLVATQNELNSIKVASIADYLDKHDGKLKDDGGALIISKEGGVVDGHHRWAGVAAYAAMNPDKEVCIRVMRIDGDIDAALKASLAFTKREGIAGAGFAATTPTFQRSKAVTDVSPVQAYVEDLKAWGRPNGAFGPPKAPSAATAGKPHKWSGPDAPGWTGHRPKPAASAPKPPAAHNETPRPKPPLKPLAERQPHTEPAPSTTPNTGAKPAAPEGDGSNPSAPNPQTGAKLPDGSRVGDPKPAAAPVAPKPAAAPAATGTPPTTNNEPKGSLGDIDKKTGQWKPYTNKAAPAARPKTAPGSHKPTTASSAPRTYPKMLVTTPSGGARAMPVNTDIKHPSNSDDVFDVGPSNQPGTTVTPLSKKKEESPAAPYLEDLKAWGGTARTWGQTGGGSSTQMPASTAATAAAAGHTIPQAAAAAGHTIPQAAAAGAAASTAATAAAAGHTTEGNAAAAGHTIPQAAAAGAAAHPSPPANSSPAARVPMAPGRTSTFSAPTGVQKKPPMMLL